MTVATLLFMIATWTSLLIKRLLMAVASSFITGHLLAQRQQDVPVVQQPESGAKGLILVCYVKDIDRRFSRAHSHCLFGDAVVRYVLPGDSISFIDRSYSSSVNSESGKGPREIVEGFAQRNLLGGSPTFEFD